MYMIKRPVIGAVMLATGMFMSIVVSAQDAPGASHERTYSTSEVNAKLKPYDSHTATNTVDAGWTPTPMKGRPSYTANREDTEADTDWHWKYERPTVGSNLKTMKEIQEPELRSELDDARITCVDKYLVNAENENGTVRVSVSQIDDYAKFVAACMNHIMIPVNPRLTGIIVVECQKDDLKCIGDTENYRKP
jgi:hypothetical protein